MVERRKDARFTLEAGQAIAIRADGVRQHLDRDLSSELGVAGAVNLAHSARPDRREDLVRTDPPTGLEAHSSGLM